MKSGIWVVMVGYITFCFVYNHILSKKGVYNILIGIHYFIIIKFIFFISLVLKILIVKSNIIDRSLDINQCRVVRNLICIVVIFFID